MHLPLRDLFTSLTALLQVSTPGSPALTARELDVGQPAAWTEVARLEVELPDGPSFLLRGTLPLPPGVHPSDGSERRLAVADLEGRPLDTQIEIVSRYADETLGADVVELLARVPNPAWAPDPGFGPAPGFSPEPPGGGSDPDDAAPAVAVQFPVLLLDDPVPVAPPQVTGPAALTELPRALPADLRGLLADPTAIELRTRDVFGHVYNWHPLDPVLAPVLQRAGTTTVELQTTGQLGLETAVEGAEGTLPHAFGVQAYASTRSGDPSLGLELQLFNGYADLTEGTTDDNIGALYFDALELLVPADWTVEFAHPDAGAGAPVIEGDRRVVPLVGPLTDGALHVFPQSAQMVRRLALAPLGREEWARSFAEREGLGFAVAGFAAGTDAPLWSWSNPDTARYFPQRFPLPSVEYAGLEAVRSELAERFERLAVALASGTSYGELPLISERLGWAHPFGARYGGVTGGIGIHLFDGVVTAMSRSKTGYRYFELVHQMQSDRQPTPLYTAAGRPPSYLDLLVDDGGVGYVPLQFYMQPIGGPDTLGIKTTPSFQRDAVVLAERTPAYMDALFEFSPYDLQHLIRYTRGLKVLAWLGNDSLAKAALEMQAELVRLSYHPHYNNAFGGSDETGMRRDLDQLALGAGRGLDFGRGEGWACDTTAAAFALAEPQWRAEAFSWYATLAAMVRDAQVPCSGHLMAVRSTKLLDGNYRAAQSYSMSIVDNALRGLRESVLLGRDPVLAEDLRGTLIAHYDGFIGPLSWNDTVPGPREVYAVAPSKVASTPYCLFEELPADAIMDGINGYQTWSTFGYAFEATDDPEFLTRAEAMLGAELLGGLQAAGLENIENRAALISVVQRLAAGAAGGE